MLRSKREEDLFAFQLGGWGQSVTYLIGRNSRSSTQQITLWIRVYETKEG